MIKFLFTGLLIYFVYRFFIAPPAIDGSSQSDTGQQNQQADSQRSSSHEDEYIDYEEVD